MKQIINNNLIAFTGPDGIGKTTQSKLLVNWINSKEFRDNYKHYYANYVKELNDSNYIFKALKELVYSLYKQVSVITLANAIKVNRYILQDEINIELKDYSNTIVVVDRWNICTYSYLKSKDIVEDICLSYLNDSNTVIPGLTIMLVGMNGATRTENRKENNNMFEDVGNEFNTKLAQTYIDFDESLYAGKIVKINNDNLTKDETQELIRVAVFEYLTGIK